MKTPEKVMKVCFVICFFSSFTKRESFFVIKEDSIFSIYFVILLSQLHMFVLNKDKGFVHFFCERTSFRRTPGQPNRYQEHTKNILRQWCFKVKQWNHVRFTNSNLIRSNSNICLSLACFHSFFHKKRLVWCWIPKFRLMNLSKYFLSTSHRFF